MGKARRKRTREPSGPERRPTATAPVPAPADDGRRARLLLLILAGAALFRAVYLLQYRGSVFFDTPFFDSLTYDRWAREIAGGEWVSAEPFYFAPGYPYALAFIYRFVSPSLVAVYVVQLLLGLLDIVLVHRLTAEAFGRRAATLAALLAALYAPLPFFETKLLSPTLAITLLLLTLLALVRAQRDGVGWRWALAGVLLGAASLVRPETLVLAPLLLAWMYRWARRWWVAAAVLAVSWAAVIAPAVIHNARGGAGLTISSQGAITFYQSNNPRANGLYVLLAEEGFSGHPRLQAAEEQQIAEKALGRSLTRAEVSSYWRGRALAFIREHPGRFVWLLGMKLLRFVGSYEYATEYNFHVERETTWLLWLPFVPFGLLVALALPTIARGGPGERDATRWLLLITLAANFSVVLLFYVSSRYRLSSLPPLLAFAAATLAALGESLRRGRRTEVYATAAVVAVLFIVLHLEKDAASRSQEASQHNNIATAWVKRGDHEHAVAEYRRALAMVGTRADSWYGLANALRRLGRKEEAADAFGETAARRPEFFEARALQGLMLEEAGDWAGARAAYEQAARLRPDDFEVQLRLGRAAARLGDRAAAVRHLDRALALQPDSEAARAERAAL